ncbi:hypothetical protein GLYMA_02G197100v4 [Glycine max]|uniref:Uncharacterized protein n=2 Tax=Glycine subgen. Soja TaxID=1462606 RepID=K7K9L4_SOYBN|nr:hypothetical protein JHK85_004983 [Glycine max]KHN02582.1 hypothetical protein glysoja_043878 [Glycine soja]KAG5080753.1 hypothetical protein JHK86_004818 [Glycine max]KAH1061176.1 hypothetical protein GYH30_004593 [Glycine max]KRH72192.1 hypothetical protein GLYMA_02G197100v4 [Glycine max]
MGNLPRHSRFKGLFRDSIELGQANGFRSLISESNSKLVIHLINDEIVLIDACLDLLTCDKSLECVFHTCLQREATS